MLQGRALRENLVALVEEEAALPGGRDRVVEHLRAALASVEPARPVLLTTRSEARALGELATSLSQAASHAEFLAEKVSERVTAEPLP